MIYPKNHPHQPHIGFARYSKRTQNFYGTPAPRHSVKKSLPIKPAASDKQCCGRGQMILKKVKFHSYVKNQPQPFGLRI